MQKVVAKWHSWVSEDERSQVVKEVESVSAGKIQYDKIEGAFVSERTLSQEESDNLMYAPQKEDSWYEAGVSGCLESFAVKKKTSGINYFTHGISGQKD